MIKIMDQRKAQHVSYEVPGYSQIAWNKRRRLQDINNYTQDFKDLQHYFDMVYLGLLMNLRQFEREELPKMRKAMEFLGSFGGVLSGMNFLSDLTDSFLYSMPEPEKSKEELFFEDRCYEMWEELDKIEIFIDRQTRRTENK